MKRVVITGVGAVSPFGVGAERLWRALLEGRSGVVAAPEIAERTGIRPRVAGPVTGVDPAAIPRKFRRSMSPMSMYAYLAALEALETAGIGPEILGGGRLGVVVGSTIGSPMAIEEVFGSYAMGSGLEKLKGTLFFQIMSHSVATNLAQALNIRGRPLTCAAACSTSGQAIGLAAEQIRWGVQDFMLCGGADELHPLVPGAFDLIDAASYRYNATPEATPRPFDSARDGIVCSEGAGVLTLESLDSALARGADILGEVLGFATTCDPENIATSSAESIEECMRLALDDAGVLPERVGYVSAHATATELGDVFEGQAIAALFGSSVPVSSLKGHLGHAMAASGALEIIATLRMLREGVLLPTRNLSDPDPRCGDLGLFVAPVKRKVRTVIKNNFALGGVNSSLVIGSYSHD